MTKIKQEMSTMRAFRSEFRVRRGGRLNPANLLVGRGTNAIVAIKARGANSWEAERVRDVLRGGPGPDTISAVRVALLIAGGCVRSRTRS